MKKILAVFLVVLTLAMLFPFAVSAEGVKVEVTGVPESIKAGDPIAMPSVTVPAGASYKIDDAKWQVLNYSLGAYEEVSSGSFENGKVYRFNVELASSSVNLSEAYYDDKYYINGVKDNTNVDVFGPSSVDINVYFPLGVQLVDTVELTGAPEEKIGASTAFSGFTLTAASHCRIKTEECVWYDNGSIYKEATLGKSAYSVRVAIVPEEGYWLSRTTVVKHGFGERARFDLSNYGIMMVDMNYNTMDKIPKAEVTVKEAALGATVDNTVTVPAGVAFTATAQWINVRTGAAATVFEAGNKYGMEIRLKAAEGHTFDDNTEFYLNGKFCKDAYYYQGLAILTVEANYLKPLAAVDVPAAPAVKAGDDIPAPSLEDKGDYKATAMWFVLEDNSLKTASGKFESGKLYYRVILINAAGAYEFTLGTALTSGEKAYGGRYTVKNDQIMCCEGYNFGARVVERIDVTCGEMGPDKTTTKVTLSDGTALELEGYDWLENETGQLEDLETIEDGAAFRAGRYYGLKLKIASLNGVPFSPDVKIYLNGEEARQYSYSAVLGDACTVILDLGQVAGSAPSQVPTGDGTPLQTLVAVSALTLVALAALIPARKKFF